MLEQRRLDLEAGDVVARRDDHVVGARLEPEVAVLVHRERVAGDVPAVDDEGYYVYQARTDDMIVSAGYNIAGPEVESALLAHPAVAECGVVGAPDEERGQIVKAYVVLRPGHAGDVATTKLLQDYVKATIAPYKYPRAVEYVTALPRTQTGKLQRFELRRIASDTDSHKMAS